MDSTPPPRQQLPGSPVSSSSSSNMRFSPSLPGLAVLGQGLDLEERVAMNFTGSDLHSGQQRLRNIIEARRAQAPSPVQNVQPEIDSTGGVMTDTHRFISSDPVDESILESVASTLPLLTAPITTAPVIGSVSAVTQIEQPRETPAAAPTGAIPTVQFPVAMEASLPLVTVGQDLAGPSHLPLVTSNASAAAGVQDLSWVIPAGYPPIDDIFSEHPNRAASLYESGLVGQLSVISAAIVKRAGLKTFTLGPTHTVRLTAYDQLVLAVICRYYSTLPNVDFSPEVHHALHVTYAYHIGRPVVDNDETKEFYLHLSSEGLENVAVLLARLMMPEIVLNSRSIFDNTTVAASKSLMDRVRTQCPTAIAAYRMMYQLYFGGIECISPIPDILKFEDTFCTYINSIAKGTSSIASTNIVLPSRDTRLPVIYPPVTVEAPIVPLPAPATVVTTQTLPAAASIVGYGDAVQPSRTSILPQPQPALQVGAGTAPPAWAETVASMALATPADFVRPAQPPPVTTSVLPTRPPVPNQPTQLIPQGAPRHEAVVRDTTMFRQSVTNHAELITSVNLVMEVCANISSDVLANREILQDIVRRIANLEQALNSGMVMNAAQDLNLRLNLNRAVVPPLDPNMAAAAASAQPVQSPNQARAQQFAAQLRDPSCMTNYPNLAAELSAYLLEIGHPAVAATVTPSFLQSERARRKLAARLGTL